MIQWFADRRVLFVFLLVSVLPALLCVVLLAPHVGWPLAAAIVLAGLTLEFGVRVAFEWWRDDRVVREIRRNQERQK